MQRNIAVSVQVKQVAGDVTATYGISLRYAGAGSFYKFLITSNSTWRFTKSVKYKFITIVAETANTAIKPGLNTINTLLVRVQGAHFDFFVNGIKVGEATDTSFSAGLVGLTGDDNADAAFNNFQVAALIG